MRNITGGGNNHRMSSAYPDKRNAVSDEQPKITFIDELGKMKATDTPALFSP
jgi:hypothetical protein